MITESVPGDEGPGLDSVRIAAWQPNDPEIKTRAEQIQLLYGGVPLGLVGSAGAAIFLVAVTWGQLPRQVSLGWLATLMLPTMLFWLLWLIRRNSQDPDVHHAAWGKAHTLVSAIAGLVWGGSTLLLDGLHLFWHQVIVVVVLAGISSASLTIMAPRALSNLALIVPMLTPAIAWNFLQGDPAHTAIALFGLLHLCAVSLVAVHLQRTLVSKLRLSHENRFLAETLAREKARTEETNIVLTAEIRERRAIEIALEASRSRLRTIIESEPEGLMILDCDGCLTEGNPAAWSLLEVGDTRQLLGQPLRSLVVEAYSGGFWTFLARVLKGNSCAYEFELIGLQGTRRWVDLHATPMRDGQGSVVSVLGVARDVTVRKEVEADLRRLGQLYESILNSVQDGIYGVDCNARITFINPKALSLVGWQRDELLGQSSHELLHHTRVDGSAYPFEDCPVFKSLRDGEENHVVDEVFWRKDGSFFSTEYASTPILEQRQMVGAVVVFRDVTERVQQQATLRDSENAIRALCQVIAMPDSPPRDQIKAVLSMGRDRFGMDIAILSQVQGERYKVLSAVSSDEAIATGTEFDLYVTYCREVLMNREPIGFEQASAGELREHPCFRKFGLEAYLGAPVIVENQLFGTLSFSSHKARRIPFTAVDREVIQLMAQWMGGVLGQQARSEDARLRQSELAHAGRLALVGEMASAMAHELNQPLTAVVSFAETAQRLAAHKSCPSAQLSTALEQVVKQGERASAIIRRVREFVRKGPQKRSAWAINDLVEEVVALTRWDAERRAIHLELDLDSNLPKVMVDRIQIEQVILNLLQNAMEASAQSSVTAIVELGTACSGRGEVRVSVRDSGPGLPVELAGRVFDAFQTTKAEGLGIGLAISRGIVEAHGGRVRAENHPQGGAVFGFSLPSAKLPSEQSRQ